MSKENVLIVQTKKAYYYPWEEQCIEPMDMSGFNLIVRKLCKVSNIAIPKYLLNPLLLDSRKVIFTDSAFHIGIYKSCLKKIGRNDLILYYLNVIDDNITNYMKYFDKSNIYTFDRKDADKFNIHHKHTPFSDKIQLKRSNLEFDAIFLGRAKNKTDEILHLYDMLKKAYISSKFMVLDIDVPEIKINSYMEYTEYLKMLSKTRCIIEINDSKQVGCTLRFMESLFLKKKLITNNTFIVEDPYYNSDNVFIIGKDDPKTLKKFISQQYKNNGKKHDELIFNNWINSF